MKFKPLKIKFFQLLVSLRLIYFLVIILIIVLAVILGLFLYKNLYKTIAQSEEIIILRKEVAPEFISLEEVNKIVKKIDKKITAEKVTNWLDWNNPFAFIGLKDINSPIIQPSSESAIKNSSSTQ